MNRLIAAAAVPLVLLVAPAAAAGRDAHHHHKRPRAAALAKPAKVVSVRVATATAMPARVATATPAPRGAELDGLDAGPLPAAPLPPSRSPLDAALDPGAAPARAAVPLRYLPQRVAYDGPGVPGTIVVDTRARFLYLIGDDGTAWRYGVGVGRPGFQWQGRQTVTRKAVWPSWRPPADMRKRQPDLPTYMAGGPSNPLGARALYLGSTEYRIHGTTEPWTIGQAASAGCIRMRNEDVADLYEKVKVGTAVQVL